LPNFIFTFMTYDSSLADFYEKAAYIKLFSALAGNNLLLEANPPSFTILAATTQRLQDVGMTKEAVIGKALFEAHPGNPTDPSDNGVSNLRSSLEHVLRYKEVHQLPVQRYDLPDDQGGFAEKYWRASNRPVLNNEGEVAYIIHTAEDITHEIKARELEEKIKGLEQAYGLFMQAPFAIHIFTGPDLVIELANPPTLELWGETEDVTGKCFLDVLPELEGQGYDVMMHDVMRTGEVRFFYEVPLQLNRPGKEPTGYFNFVYQPYYKEGASKAESVLIIANEVTPQVLAKKGIEESEARLSSIIEQTPAPTLVLRGDDYLIEHINGPMLEMIGHGEEVAGQPFLSIMPELKGQAAWEQVQKVYADGISFDQPEILVPHKRAGVMQEYYYNVSYRPLKEDGQVTGMIQVAIDVSEQVLSRKKLEESDERYRTLLEETTVATAFYTGPDIRIRYANSTMLLYWGKGREVIGKTFREALPELEGQPFPGLLEAVYATGDPYIGIEEKAELQVEGELQTFYFNFTYKALRDAQGHIYAIHHTAIDVTEQMTARKKIEQSEARFRNLVLDSPTGTAVFTGREMRIAMANEPMLKNWAKDASVINKTLQEAIPELVGQDFFGVLQGVYDTGVPFQHNEAPADLLVDGELQRVYFNYSLKPLYNEDGVIYGVINTGTDVTETVIGRQKIEEQSVALRNAIEIAELGTWKVDVETGGTHLSERQAAMLGISQLSLSVEDGLRLVAEADRERVAKAFQEAMQPESGGRYDSEFRIINATSGKTHVLRTLGQARFDAAGKLIGMEGTSQDVTLQRELQTSLEVQVQQRTKELAEANESLHVTNKELQRSNHHLEEFAHAASHDLKEPVRKIYFFTNQLKQKLKTSLQDDEARMFNRIENATERMGNLIDDLLLYSHVSQQFQEKESVDLNDKIHKVLEDLELDIQDKKATFNIKKLPVVEGTGRQLQQLFQNLISNAIKYSKADVPPYIIINALPVEKAGRAYLCIEVTDNGIGFEQEYEDKIFQMFSRLHGKGEYSGTGIGLSIVKKIVENHNGLIEVKSEVGTGSVFKVYLPSY
jgi:PAS domain S-box-containing protein